MCFSTGQPLKLKPNNNHFQLGLGILHPWCLKIANHTKPKLKHQLAPNSKHDLTISRSEIHTKCTLTLISSSYKFQQLKIPTTKYFSWEIHRRKYKIRETIGTFSSSSGIASLNEKRLNHSMKNRVVVEAFEAQLHEVPYGLRRLLRPQLDVDGALRRRQHHLPFGRRLQHVHRRHYRLTSSWNSMAGFLQFELARWICDSTMKHSCFRVSNWGGLIRRKSRFETTPFCNLF